MRVKPNKRWVARTYRVIDGRTVFYTESVDASAWFLARQAAAVLLRADPSDIDVREAKP